MDEKILPVTLRTERLLLRAPQKEDAEDFYAYASGDVVGPMAGWQPHRSRRITRQIISAYARNASVLAITLKGEGRMIGTVGLHEDDHRPGTDTYQLGYALSPAYWHRGIMREAALAVLTYGFETKLLRMVTAYCYPENEPSRRLLLDLGFTHEGRLRKSYLLYDGSLHDLDCYSLTIEEYTAKYY